MLSTGSRMEGESQKARRVCRAREGTEGEGGVDYGGKGEEAGMGGCCKKLMGD